VLNTKLVQKFTTIARTNFQRVFIFLVGIMLFLPQISLLSKELGRTCKLQFSELVNVEIFPCVEYQSWAKYCDDHAHQNSAFLHEGTESYENLSEC
jgi:hypothetical protein